MALVSPPSENSETTLLRQHTPPDLISALVLRKEESVTGLTLVQHTPVYNTSMMMSVSCWWSGALRGQSRTVSDARSRKVDWVGATWNTLVLPPSLPPINFAFECTFRGNCIQVHCVPRPGTSSVRPRFVRRESGTFPDWLVFIKRKLRSKLQSLRKFARRPCFVRWKRICEKLLKNKLNYLLDEHNLTYRTTDRFLTL